MQIQKALFWLALFFIACKEHKVSSQRQLARDDAGPRFLAVITSKDGLFLRAKPERSSQKIELITFAQSVEIHPQKNPVTETIDGINGEWLGAYYYGSNGFIFSGYVKRFAELAGNIENLDEDKILGYWQSSKYKDYTKVPITKLHFKPKKEFQFNIFAGGDGGGFSTKSLKGTWQVSNNLIILTESQTLQQLRYAMYKKHLILAEESPKAEHHVFLENFDAEYPSGLSR